MNLLTNAMHQYAYTEQEAAALLIKLIRKQAITRLDAVEYKELLELEALLMLPEPLPSDSKSTWSRNLFL